MEKVALDNATRALLLIFQENEISEYHIYSTLDELKHYHEWKKYSGAEVKSKRLRIFLYLLIARIFGLTFAIKMMEKGEENAQDAYRFVAGKIPAVSAILEDEVQHEQLLVEMIDEEKIGYISSMVLGLNDAIVELTGALAGFTLALRDAKVIGMAGFITGIAAALSMAASEYLSKKSEAQSKDPLRASFYTGVTYLGAVLLLVLPYFLVSSYYLALSVTLSVAILIILVFSQFVSVVKDISFGKFFWEMVGISMGVAAISFFIGWLARLVFNVEI
ncbi:MAG: VIT1/CCC1 transporter family protein [Calditrichia bacterium]